MSRISLEVQTIGAGESISLEQVVSISIDANDTTDPDAPCHYEIENRQGEKLTMRKAYNVGGNVVIDFMKINAITPTKIIYYLGFYNGSQIYPS